jgi:SAM-dependent methyltransferase
MGNHSIKQYLKRRAAQFVRQVVQHSLPDMGEQMMQLATYYPHAQTTYSVPVYRKQAIRQPDEMLPIPPRRPFWANYCTSVDTWLQSGKDDTDTMRRLLLESAFEIEQSRKILELGVAGGRLIRHLRDLTPNTEIWGVDIWASAVRWCQEHLSPPFHFATTTVVPHLPFADQTFDLVYAGSVFTHLDDLAEAWFLELRRILEIGGRLYFTVNDRHAVSIFEGAGAPDDRARYIERVEGEASWQRWLDYLHNTPEYAQFLKGDVQMITMGRPGICHVLWDVDYLKDRIGPNWKWHSITPEAYGHQTGVLIERQ